ncbi:MAG TPA: thioesterase family protein [Myxococcales bacterium]|nr:thioesterase family protein [Myxococcales bacterium]
MVPYRHRVIYGDTDQMGVVYYGNYLRFFEAARGDWIRNLGLTYAQIEERGIFLPVLEVGVRYLKFARYDDLLEIPLDVSHTRVKVRFDYKVYRAGEPDVLLLGHTVHACVNKEGRPTRAPDWLISAMAGAATSRPTLSEGYEP